MYAFSGESRVFPFMLNTFRIQKKVNAAVIVVIVRPWITNCLGIDFILVGVRIPFFNYFFFLDFFPLISTLLPVFILQYFMSRKTLQSLRLLTLVISCVRCSHSVFKDMDMPLFLFFPTRLVYLLCWYV